MALNLSGFKKFMYKYVSGGMSIKIGKRKYLNYPKTAHFMVPGIALTAIFQSGDMLENILFIIGLTLTAIGLFSFMYPNFDPISWMELDEEGKIWVVQSYGLETLSNDQRREYFEIVDDMTELEKQAYKIKESHK